MIILNDCLDAQTLETRPSHTVFAWICPTCFADNTLTVFGRMNPVMCCKKCRRPIIKKGGKWVSRGVPA